MKSLDCILIAIEDFSKVMACFTLHFKIIFDSICKYIRRRQGKEETSWELVTSWDAGDVG